VALQENAHTSRSTAAFPHRYGLCFKNEDLPPSIEKLSAGATMHLHHQYEANMPPTRLSPTVLGGVLMVETGGISYLRSLPRILPAMADLHIAAKIGVGGCCINPP